MWTRLVVSAASTATGGDVVTISRCCVDDWRFGVMSWSFRCSRCGQFPTALVYAVLLLSVPGRRRLDAVERQLHALGATERQRRLRGWLGGTSVTGPRLSSACRRHGWRWRLLALGRMLCGGGRMLSSTTSFIADNHRRRRRIWFLWGHVGRIQLLGPHACRHSSLSAVSRLHGALWRLGFVQSRSVCVIAGRMTVTPQSSHSVT